jgi:hypothetical protein
MSTGVPPNGVTGAFELTFSIAITLARKAVRIAFIAVSYGRVGGSRKRLIVPSRLMGL